MSRTKASKKRDGSYWERVSTDPPAGSPTAVGSSVISIVSSGPRAFPWTMAMALVAAVVVAGIGVSFTIAIWGGGGREPGVGAGASSPSATIVSDLPLQGANRAQSMSMVNAIKLA